jgi:ADP-L-glycero-D-manno-heptose 6-epimerase
MSILITGFNGLIGSKLFHEHPNSLGIEVLADNVFLSGRKLDPIKIEPTQQGFIEAITKRQVTAVIHMGAITSTMERDVQKFKRWNIDFSNNLLDACLVTNTKFIFASSQAVYGKLSNISEDVTILPPNNPYAYSKFKTEEHLVKKLSQHETSQTVVALRLSNVYGLNELHKGAMASTIFQFWNSAKTGNSIKVFSVPEKVKGSQSRDFISVDQVTHAIDLILSEKTPLTGIYNLGSGIATEFKDLANIVMKVAECNPGLEFVEMPLEISENYQWHTKANISKLQKRINFPVNGELELELKKIYGSKD